MSMFGKSVGYKLARSAEDVLSIASQEKGMGAGLAKEVAGMFDGGLSGSAGLSHTIAEVGKVVGGAVIEQWRLTDKVGLPFGLPTSAPSA